MVDVPILLLSMSWLGATSLLIMEDKIANGFKIFSVGLMSFPQFLNEFFHWSIIVMKNPRESVLKASRSLISKC